VAVQNVSNAEKYYAVEIYAYHLLSVISVARCSSVGAYVNGKPQELMKMKL